MCTKPEVKDPRYREGTPLGRCEGGIEFGVVVVSVVGLEKKKEIYLGSSIKERLTSCTELNRNLGEIGDRVPSRRSSMGF